MMAYTSNTAVKTYLGITGSGDDTLLTTLIGVADSRIDELFEYSFAADAAATRYFDLPDDRWRLKIPALETLTTLTNGDGITIASSEYKLYPLNQAVKTEVVLLRSSGKYFVPANGVDVEGCISILGDWGYSTLPEWLVQASIELTAWLYRNRYGDGGQLVAVGKSGVLKLPVGMPLNVKQWLVSEVGIA